MKREICGHKKHESVLEHFTHLEQLMLDQHGVQGGHDPMLNLVHDVGEAADQKRLADVEFWNSQAPQQRTWPAADVTLKRVYVSCDGIMYCTNQSEPDPKNPD